MAGYVFNLDDVTRIPEIARDGVYSTRINKFTSGSSTSFEGVFGDYASMKPGDNVYFFSKRKIYGIGSMVSINGDCKYCNFPLSSEHHEFDFDEVKDSILYINENNPSESTKYRWICFFEPSPNFYKNGIDTDEVLVYKPTAFRALRTNWKVSFIKIDDEENQALKEVILLRNIGVTQFFSYSDLYHKGVYKKISDMHRLSINPFLYNLVSFDRVRHEMALESATILLLSSNQENIFGRWDFITHQLAASPFKPIDYMDKIDVFGYRFLEVGEDKIIEKYLVIEIKKDKATVESLMQLSNYVDWICNQYAYGNYSMIKAYLLASEFDEAIKSTSEIYERHYNLGSHPIVPYIWKDLNLVKYRVNDSRIEYSEVK